MPPKNRSMFRGVVPGGRKRSSPETSVDRVPSENAGVRRHAKRGSSMGESGTKQALKSIQNADIELPLLKIWSPPWAPRQPGDGGKRRNCKAPNFNFVYFFQKSAKIFKPRNIRQKHSIFTETRTWGAIEKPAFFIFSGLLQISGRKPAVFRRNSPHFEPTLDGPK